MRHYVVHNFSAQMHACMKYHKTMRTIYRQFTKNPDRQSLSVVPPPHPLHGGHFTAQLGSFLWMHIQLLCPFVFPDSDLMACLKGCPHSHPLPLQKLDCGHGNKASAYPTSTGNTWGHQPRRSASDAMSENFMCFHYSRCYCWKSLCLYEMAGVKVSGLGRALLINLLP